MATLEFFILALILAAFIFFILECLAPGFGVFGILGIVCTIIAIAITILFDKSPIYIYVGLALILYAIIAIVFIFTRPNASKGIINTEILNEEIKMDYSKYIGKEGVTKTVLKPLGVVTIGNEDFEVVSKLSFVDKGEKVKIVSLCDGKLFVEKI